MRQEDLEKLCNQYARLDPKTIKAVWDYWHKIQPSEYLRAVIDQILTHIEVYRAHPRLLRLKKYLFSYFPYCIRSVQGHRVMGVDSRGHIFLTPSITPSHPRVMNDISTEIHVTESFELHPTSLYCITNQLFYPAAFILDLGQLNLGNFELELVLSSENLGLGSVQANLQQAYSKLFSNLLQRHLTKQIQHHHYRLEDIQLNTSLAELLVFHHFLPTLKSRSLLKRYMTQYGFEFSENRYVKRCNGHMVELIGNNVQIDHKHVCIQFRAEPIDLDENDQAVAKLLALTIPGIRYNASLTPQLSPYYRILEEMFDHGKTTESESEET